MASSNLGSSSLFTRVLPLPPPYLKLEIKLPSRNPVLGHPTPFVVHLDPPTIHLHGVGLLVRGRHVTFVLELDESITARFITPLVLYNFNPFNWAKRLELS